MSAGSLALRRTLKVLHELGSAGVMGSFAACLVLASTAPTRPLVAYAAARQGIAAIGRWLVVPSVALVMISGLLAIAANRAYRNAGWAWVKAFTGMALLEGTLLTVVSVSRDAAELAALAVAGRVDPAALADVIHNERISTWMLMALCLANIVIGVWRPRIAGSAAR